MTKRKRKASFIGNRLSAGNSEMAHRHQLTVEQAEGIAIRGLQHIAGDRELLQRFLSLTGVDPKDLRDAAGSTTFLSGVLDFYMGDEAALQAFAASIGEDPSIVPTARNILSRSYSDDSGNPPDD